MRVAVILHNGPINEESPFDKKFVTGADESRALSDKIKEALESWTLHPGDTIQIREAKPGERR